MLKALIARDKVQHVFVSLTGSFCQCQTSRGFLSKLGVSRDTYAWLNQPIDFSYGGLRNWLIRRGEKALVDDHRFVPERVERLGPELAAAHFVVARHGAVKFEGSARWISVSKSSGDTKYQNVLPTVPSVDLRLEAIDMSDTDMMYISFDNLKSLKSLKYLNVAGCCNIDDWCLDRFVQFRDSLVVLDVSRCPLVTERGLASLHKLHQLRRLRMYDMPAVNDKKLVALLLEEACPAGCVVEGVDFTASEDEPTARTLPSFLKRYEDIALAEDRERSAVIESDMRSVGLDSSSLRAATEQEVRDKHSEEKKMPS